MPRVKKISKEVRHDYNSNFCKNERREVIIQIDLDSDKKCDVKKSMLLIHCHNAKVVEVEKRLLVDF